MESHPHILHKGNDEESTIYIATERLTWNRKLPGWGVFNYHKKLVLTKKDHSKSKWNLPEFFKPLNITYHSENSWKKEYFQPVGRGQEFIIEEDVRVTEWARDLIDTCAAREL